MFGIAKKLSLKLKLMIFIGLLLLISIGIVSTVSFTKSKQALEELNKNQLNSKAISIKDSMEGYLSRSKSFTENLSRNRLVEGLLIAYESSFFGSNFDPGKDLKIDNQFYEKLEKTYGERKKKLLEEYDLKDLLLVSLDAQIIFTANNSQKEFYLGRNLENGVFKDSSLAACYKNALSSEKVVLFFSGFNYSDVTKSVNGFICGKKKAEFTNADEGIDKGDDIGVIITKIDIGAVNSILTSRIGMGKTGQSYLIGSDKLLRSDFYIEQAKFNAINSLSNIMPIDTIFTNLALEGKEGNMFAKNSIGYEVLASYRPFSYMDKSYAIITEKSYDEIFESVQNTLLFTIVLSAISFLIIMLLTNFVTKIILKPVEVARDTLSNVSGNLKTNAESLQSFSNSLREGAENTSSSIHETVSTMNELSEMVNKTLDNVKQASMRSNDVVESVNKGKSETDEMQVSVNDISKNSEEMIGTITNMNTSMNNFKEVILNISEKTNVIHDIVSQTKLLSFNASVEAARAGELGKGFAVVAEEVGNLASASGTAAEEIGKLISTSVENVEKMINEVTNKVAYVKVETKTKIDNGLTKAKSCEDSLSLINTHIDGMGNTISEISVASNEQANGITEVSASMSALSKTAQETTKVASNTLKYSGEILEKSEELIQVSKNLDQLLSGSSSGV